MAGRIDESPNAQIQQLVATARRDFAGDVDALLTEVYQWSRSLGDAIGEVSREEALRALRQVVLERFDQRLPMRLHADPVRVELVHLVRDAARLFDVIGQESDTLGWWSDVKDWQRSAAPFLAAMELIDPRRM